MCCICYYYVYCYKNIFLCDEKNVALDEDNFVMTFNCYKLDATT